MSERVLDGRVALVTGASRGIGAAVAKALAAEGAHLVLVARTVGGLEEVDDAVRAAGSEATLVPLDLAAPDGIEQLAPAIFQRFGRLDILVGNAGVLGGLYPTGHMPAKTWDDLFAINVTANRRLIATCEPLLRASDAGRAIFTTTEVAREALPYWGPYAASKAALEALVKSWAAELKNTPVRINLVDPGAVATKLRAQAFPGEDKTRLPQPDSVAGLFVDLARPDCRRTGQIIR